jgi:hypothetical protein
MYNISDYYENITDTKIAYLKEFNHFSSADVNINLNFSK